MNMDYMEFICWVDRCLFPGDLANDLRKLGMDTTTSTFYEVEWKMQNQRENQFTITRLYQNYCVGDEEMTSEGTLGHFLQLWLNDMYTQWEGYKE